MSRPCDLTYLGDFLATSNEYIHITGILPRFQFFSELFLLLLLVNRVIYIYTFDNLSVCLKDLPAASMAVLPAQGLPLSDEV